MMGAVPQEKLREAFVGVLLGTAVGDALGLPAEGMSRQRIQRRWHGQWRHRFLFGRGMISDDTERTLFVAQALLAHPNDPAAFQRCLAGKLRLWLLGIPAGIGFATLSTAWRSHRLEWLLVTFSRPESCPPGFGRRRDPGLGSGAEPSSSSWCGSGWSFSTKNLAQFPFQGLNFFPDCDGAFELFDG